VIPADVGHLIPIEAGRRFRSMSAGVASARWQPSFAIAMVEWSSGEC
jgi:hypothetical protein